MSLRVVFICSGISLGTGMSESETVKSSCGCRQILSSCPEAMTLRRMRSSPMLMLRRSVIRPLEESRTMRSDSGDGKLVFELWSLSQLERFPLMTRTVCQWRGSGVVVGDDGRKSVVHVKLLKGA